MALFPAPSPLLLTSGVGNKLIKQKAGPGIQVKALSTKPQDLSSRTEPSSHKLSSHLYPYPVTSVPLPQDARVISVYSPEVSLVRLSVRREHLLGVIGVWWGALGTCLRRLLMPAVQGGSRSGAHRKWLSNPLRAGVTTQCLCLAVSPASGT